MQSNNLTKQILIDSNLLLLLYIGYISEDFIGKFKRTQKYTSEDFWLLVRLLGSAQKIFVTPNILTEVSNLANALSGSYREQFSAIFAEGIQLLDEESTSSAVVSRSAPFSRFDLTDAAIIDVLRAEMTLLTDDLALAVYVSAQGGNAINFNNLRFYS